VEQAISPRDAVVKMASLKTTGSLVLGDTVVAIETLLDTGAEMNVIDPSLALQLRLPVAEVALPKAPAWGSGNPAYCYGAYLVKWEAVDANGESRRCEHIAYALEHVGPQLILGMPALHKQRIVCDLEALRWWFKERTTTISMITAGECKAEVEHSSYIFVVQEIPLADEDDEAESKMALPTVPPEIQDFADVFSDHAAVTQPPHPEAEHAIETTLPPPYGPIYPQSARELEELRGYISEAKANGWIRDSTSPAGSPILFVPKQDGSLRLCVDYRGLNKVTIKNRHPLPLIAEILDRLSGAMVFSKLDLKWAYHRIRIRRGDEWKTAFRTRYGHFEYLVMPFGLANAPATFQAYINKTLGELVDTICIVYLDDIIIYSNSVEAHAKHLRDVLSRLRAYGLFCNLKKCEFFTNRVIFLGFVITTDGVEMDPRKVDTITSWPKPTTFSELQTFLGFCNFYRRFIHAYSKIVAPLTSMLKGSVNGKKEGPFEWSDGADHAFTWLIEAFTTAPVLVHFEPRERIRVETDASAFAAAAILSQLSKDKGQWHPVAFWSRKFIDAERNYETHDQELLAIVAAFKHWRHYLGGSAHPIEVLTDHNNLVGFAKIKQLNGRQARWAMFLSAFDFMITHRAGKHNPADAPSRRPDYADGEKAANQMLPTLFAKLAIKPEEPVVSALLAWSENASRLRATSTVMQQYVLPFDEESTAKPWQDAGSEPIVLRSAAIHTLAAETAYGDELMTTMELVMRAQRASAEAKALNRRIQQGELNKHWRIVDGVIRFKMRLYVPPVRAIREELLKRNHDDPYAGHFGATRTAELLRRKYHWESMDSDVAEYVRSCDICQKTKVKRHMPYGEMHALPRPSRPWQEIALDFMSGIPLSMRDGVAYDAILVVVDRFSKMALYYPVKKSITAVETANLLIDTVFTRYGFPAGIVSDRDPRFTSAFWSELCYWAKVKRRLSTAFHPQTDGQTERQNQTLQEYLRAFCSEAQTAWAGRLPIAEFAYNNAYRGDLGTSPFEVVLGYHPDFRFDTEDGAFKGEIPAAKERIQRIHDLRNSLQKRLLRASESQTKYYNKRHQPMRFSKGDLVIVSMKNLRIRSASKKMAQRFMGPFRIDEPIGTQAYRVHLPTSMRIHNVFHVSALEPYQRRDSEQDTLSPPELIDDEEEYEIEEILDRQRKQGAYWYKVKWKGWPSEYNQWVSTQDMANAKELKEEFEIARKTTRKRRRSEANSLVARRPKL
jgi:transposase InsO family protein